MLVQKVAEQESELSKFSDKKLKAQTAKFRERLKNGEGIDNLLVEAFASVREASKRTLGLRHFDEQILGGIFLHQGFISEMKTGEGKNTHCCPSSLPKCVRGKRSPYRHCQRLSCKKRCRMDGNNL